MLPFLTAVTLASLAASVVAKVTVYSDVLSNSTVSLLEGTSLDAPQLSGTSNETTYQWWYFDIVSTTSTNESVTIVFYNAGPNGFSGGYFDGPLSVGIAGTFENGTAFSFQAAASVQAVITETDRGLTGDWVGTGVKFRGTNVAQPNVVYEIEIDSPEMGVYGKVSFYSRAPARYSCGPDALGQSQIAFLNVGWANAIPDAEAIVSLRINGSNPLSFAGLGYHDGNWGVAPFFGDVASTYWGHTRVGPYSIVFSDGLVPAGPNGSLVEVQSGAVARDGKLLAVSCSAGAAVVRPWGANSEYPPNIATGPPTGITLSLDLGSEGTLVVNVTNDLTTINEGAYQRFLGTAVGGLENDTQYEGARVLWEQFKLIPAPGSS